MSVEGSESDEDGPEISPFCDVCACSLDYNDARICPKNIPCGHTFCTECLLRIIAEKMPSCSKCKASIPSQSFEGISLASSLAQMLIDLKKDLKEESAKDGNEEELRKNLTERKNELTDLKIGFSVALRGEDELEKSLKKMNISFEKDFNTEKTSEKAGPSTAIDLVEPRDLTNLSTEEPVAFTLRGCFFKEVYLNQIYDRLLKGKKIFAKHDVDANKIRYGRIRLRKYENGQDKILVNSLILERVDEEGAAYLWFSDIKKCATASNYKVFLEFYSPRKRVETITKLMQIKMLDNEGQPNFTQKFVNLCTAETGCTLEGDFKRTYKSIIGKGINVGQEMPTTYAWPMTTYQQSIEASNEDIYLAVWKYTEDSLSLFIFPAGSEPRSVDVAGFLKENLQNFKTTDLFIESGIAITI